MTLLSLFSKKIENPIYKRKKKKVDFELIAPKAKDVRLTGNFINWDKDGIAMKRNKNGLWRIGVSLCSGRYEYKFIVDDQWRIDPQNSELIDDSFGSVNSVKEVIL